MTSLPVSSATFCTFSLRLICSLRGRETPWSFSRINAIPPLPDCEFILTTAS